MYVYIYTFIHAHSCVNNIFFSISSTHNRAAWAGRGTALFVTSVDGLERKVRLLLRASRVASNGHGEYAIYVCLSLCLSVCVCLYLCAYVCHTHAH